MVETTVESAKTMLPIEQCLHKGCERYVLIGRGYCMRHGGIDRLRSEQREVKERNKTERCEKAAVNLTAGDGLDAEREQKRRLHSQGLWGTRGPNSGKTEQKRRNRVEAEKRLKAEADSQARANFVKQMLSTWRDRRAAELAGERRVDMTSPRDKDKRDKIQKQVADEAMVKKEEFEAQVAAMERLPSQPKSYTEVKKPKKEKKSKDNDDDRKSKGKGKGKKGDRGGKKK
jgi:hypothetical protein